MKKELLFFYCAHFPVLILTGGVGMILSPSSLPIILIVFGHAFTLSYYTPGIKEWITHPARRFSLLKLVVKMNSTADLFFKKQRWAHGIAPFFITILVFTIFSLWEENPIWVLVGVALGELIDIFYHSITKK